MNSWIKKIPVSRENEKNILQEIEIQQRVSQCYDFTPKILSVTKRRRQIDDNKENKRQEPGEKQQENSSSVDSEIYFIEMEYLMNGSTLADIYGEEAEDIPQNYWDEISRIISILYYEEGIEYIDLTPYNLVEVTLEDPNEEENPYKGKKKLYLIDFGHAYYSEQGMEGRKIPPPKNWFLKEFLDEDNPINGYNPDFR